MTIRADLRYTEDHEWIAGDDENSTVGITPFAAEALGEVVYLELPPVGAQLTAGQPCGEIESTKSVSDLVSPGDGEVVEINTAAVEEPSLVNADPFGDGWLFRASWSRAPRAMGTADYQELIGSGS